jgi:hypothetical protein
LPPGSFTAHGARFKFKDATPGSAILKMVIIRRANGSHDMRAAVSKFTLPVGASVNAVSLTLTVGASPFTATLACDANAAATATRCQ